MKNCKLLAQNLDEDDEKRFTCTEERLMKDWVSGEKFKFFHHFWTLSKKSFGRLEGKFRKLIKTSFYVYTGSIGGPTVFSILTYFYKHFRISSFNFPEFGENILHGCQTCILHGQKIILWRFFPG